MCGYVCIFVLLKLKNRYLLRLKETFETQILYRNQKVSLKYSP